MRNAEWEAVAEANLTHDRPALRRAWAGPAEVNRQAIYATTAVAPRGIARVRFAL